MGASHKILIFISERTKRSGGLIEVDSALTGRSPRAAGTLHFAFGRHLPLALFLVELEGKEQWPIAIVSTATAPNALEHHPLLGAAIVANHDTSFASQDATKTTRAPGTDTGECRRPSTLVVVVLVVVEQQ